MAGKQTNIRLSDKALEILGEMGKRDNRPLVNLIRTALVEYAEKHHPDLADQLRDDFLKQG